MAIGCGCKEWLSLPIAGNMLIHGTVLHFMAVAEAFGMTAGVVGEMSNIFKESGRSALENLIWFIASAQDDLVRLLEVPPHTGFRAIDAKTEAAFPTGCHL
jgi:hypothetical protein